MPLPAPPQISGSQGPGSARGVERAAASRRPVRAASSFNGLAGAVTLLTVVIVISGVIGRYIFTRIPRTMDGLEIEGTLSESALRQARRLMALWHTIHIPIGMALFVSAFVHIGAALYFATLLK